MDESGAREIAKRSRGTPRVANRLLRRVRDIAIVLNAAVVNEEIADKALLQLDVDRQGFDMMDRRYLRCLAENYGGGPAGLETLAAVLAEQKDVLDDVIEPYLMQQGMIQRTPRGRILARKGFEFLNITPPKDFEQVDLFEMQEEEK